MNVQHLIGRIMEGGGIMSSSKDGQRKRRRHDNYEENERNKRKEYPKMPSGFECFVCGIEFPTNEGRIQHLEEENAHGSMYDTGSPQESEDARRLR
ncbi:MAG: hypothetical protein QN720_07535 [Nitrososphaeraceae archaeon]|jgi:hypothetical protein|nr:hypothetical protein [Nitrososphaeraceae archaeon]MDW0332829.1 hypothetical protein [Nitrososphaeraceae archaeon]